MSDELIGFRVALAVSIALTGCGAQHAAEPAAAAPAATAAPRWLGDAQAALAEAAALCGADRGQTWGVSLCGPMILVDPVSRVAVANQPDAQGQLRPVAGAFVGQLSASDNVANTAIDWAGVHWSEIAWPLPADRDQRGILMMHESFHRVAPQIRVPAVGRVDSAHLDTVDGRYYLQLEWRALAAALQATGEERRRAATADALAFRAARAAAFPGSAAAEDALELHEGLAEYAGIVIGVRDPAGQVAAAVRALAGHVADPSFVRSFAYASGPSLGLLLDRYAPGWRARIADTRSLAGALAAALTAPLPDATVAAAGYDGAALRAVEQARAVERAAATARYRARLIDGPVVTLRFSHMKINFNPGNILPLGDAGSVYPTLRVVDDWGILEVTGGALLSSDWTAVAVPAPASAAAPPAKPAATAPAAPPAAPAAPLTAATASAPAAPIAGDGWTLRLAAGWRLEPDQRPGDLRVSRATP